MLRRVKRTPILSRYRAWAKYWTDLLENVVKSISVKMNECIKSVSVCYSIFKICIGIGKIKIFKIGSRWIGLSLYHVVLSFWWWLVVSSVYYVLTQLKFWLFCWWDWGCCWAVTIVENLGSKCAKHFQRIAKLSKDS